MNEFNDIIENNEIIMESLVNDVENMEIANEGFIENIKKGIKKALLTIVQGLKKLLLKGRQTKFKSRIIELLEKAETSLNDVSKIETQEDVDKAQNNVKQVQEGIKNLSDDVKKEQEKLEKTKNDAINNIQNRHAAMHEILKDSMKNINNSNNKINETKKSIDNALNNLKGSNKNDEIEHVTGDVVNNDGSELGSKPKSKNAKDLEEIGRMLDGLLNK